MFKMADAIENARMKCVNQYVLRARLGGGASCVVYLAEDANTGQRFAIKRYLLDQICRNPQAFDQVLRELRVAGKLVHPNVPAIYEALFVLDHRQVFLVMEYCRGGSLDRYGIIPWEAAVSAVRHVGRALKYLHTNPVMPILHGDVKPQNVMLAESPGGGLRALLADFGAGHASGSMVRVSGTPGFQGPEWQIEGHVLDAKADVYSLGMTWYVLVFGAFPEGDEVRVPPPTPGGEMLMRMLEVNPAKRASIDEVLECDVIRSASDRIDLPLIPEPRLKSAPVVKVFADVFEPAEAAQRCVEYRRELFRKRGTPLQCLCDMPADLPPRRE